MESRTYYYARVSSREQNLDRQFAAFAALGAQERDIIADKESGKSINRSGYTALKSALLRRGDTLVIKSLDRLSRNKEDTKRELQYFRENGIRLKVLDLPTTMIEYPVGQEWVLDMDVNIFLCGVNVHTQHRQNPFVMAFWNGCQIITAINPFKKYPVVSYWLRAFE